jgi:hypothetical protein
MEDGTGKCESRGQPERQPFSLFRRTFNAQHSTSNVQGKSPHPGPLPNKISRFEPLNCSSRRKEALTSSVRKRMSLLTSAAAKFMGSVLSVFRMHWDPELALPFWTAPAERQRRRRFGRVRGVWRTPAASKSGVALRFPPHSKTWRRVERFMERAAYPR